MKPTHFYIITLQYLGFRFHGWAKQPQVKTVHHMVDRTLKFVFEDQPFKTLGASRTDAMVSATEFTMELFLEEAIQDDEAFLSLFNFNLPADIKALSIEETNQEFNIIQNPKKKEYIYLFAYGQKAHPFSAPFITTIQESLDIELMRKGAALFQGKHDFRAYCKKPKKETLTQRNIDRCELLANEFYQASFFPSPSYAVQFSSQGFMRNQIRLIMGQLFRLGKNEITIDFIKRSLQKDFDEHLDAVAPASGLILNRVSFNEEY